MRKPFFFILVWLLFFTMSSGVSSGQKASAGPKIILEQEEITLMENGQEVKKEYVSKKEKETILNNIKQKVLKNIGVASEKEALDKALGQKLSNEIKKRISIKKLDQPKMKFINANGKVVKELDIRTGMQRELKEAHPMLKKPHMMGEYTARNSAVSKDGQFAIYAESLSYGVVPETKQEKIEMGDTDAGYLNTTTTVKYYDVNGDVLWKKQIPTYMLVENPAISQSGAVIAYLLAFNAMEVLPESEPPTKLVILNKEGREVLVFPVKRGENIISGESRITMSPSGRYLSVIGQRVAEHVNFFVDIKNKTMWISDAFYSVRKLEDDGLAEVSYVDVKKTGRKKIDLKPHLGE